VFVVSFKTLKIPAIRNISITRRGTLKSIQLGVLVLCTVLLFNSCASTTLFPEYWNKDKSAPFDRLKSPYEDSPDAVIVFDLEKLSVEKTNWEMVKSHHRRIQIFTEAGKEYSNIKIPFWHDESILQIKAQTILPNGERIKLKSSDIFEEGEAEGWRYKVFALPGVQDNCIIEYQYQFRTDRLAVIQPKYLQGYLQREYTQLTLTLPMGFSYSGSVRNQLPVYSEPLIEKYHLPNDEGNRYLWEIKNIPPVRDEAFMYNREDHLMSIHMQLVSYKDPYNHYTFIGNWQDLKKKMITQYESYLKPTRNLTKLYKKIPVDSTEIVPSPQVIYSYIQNNFTHRTKGGIWARYANEVLSDMQASRSEKNLLFVALLREAGYDAKPILISRRPRGRVNTIHPNLRDFNHVIVKLKHGSKTSYHDVAYDYFGFDLMPANSLSGTGLPISEGDEKLIDFPTSLGRSKQVVLSICELDETGTLSGSFSIRSTAYYATSLRRAYDKAENDEKFAYEDIVSQFPGIIVEDFSYEIPMDDLNEPVITKVSFEIPDFADFSGDQVYIPTTFYSAFKKNSLVRDQRTHNIEFDNKFTAQETINLSLPSGYEVVEAPHNITIQAPGLLFRKLIQPNNDIVQFSRSYQLSQVIQPPRNYNLIKTFFTEAVTADQSKLIIRKIDE